MNKLSSNFISCRLKVSSKKSISDILKMLLVKWEKAKQCVSFYVAQVACRQADRDVYTKTDIENLYLLSLVRLFVGTSISVYLSYLFVCISVICVSVSLSDCIMFL